MQTLKNKYDVAIVGGGLAGLALSIQLSKEGYSVVLLEKESYPYHKVCGEYISMESWPFLQSLGVPLQQMQLPVVDTLQLTSASGKLFTAKLPLGGFGISRYLLDKTLADIAIKNGVALVQMARVDEVKKEKDFEIAFTIAGQKSMVQASVCCGAFGKRSNLDVKWKRPFIASKNKHHNNFIGIKYHVKTDWPQNVIGLHNFKNGYCGISKIEGDKYCLCYLTTADNLKNCNNSIEILQQKILYQNPHLQKVFQNVEVVDGFPVTIAQISFSKKALVENDVLMLGDAAGMITPLCGNGMSMALHSSKLAAALISQYLSGEISMQQMQQQYVQQWQKLFKKRMTAGRALQYFFGKQKLTNFFVTLFKAVPFLSSAVIKKTHGQPF